MLIRIIVIVLVVAVFGQAGILLSTLPTTQIVQQGSVFSVDLVISGLTSGIAPSVGAFEVTVSYNPAAAQFTGATFGPYLGEPGVDALTDVQLGFGTANVAEVSFLPTAVLDAGHPGTYTLATLFFLGADAATFPVSISAATIDDPLGLKLPFETENSTVTITPEPRMALLILPLLALLVRRSLPTPE